MINPRERCFDCMSKEVDYEVRDCYQIYSNRDMSQYINHIKTLTSYCSKCFEKKFRYIDNSPSNIILNK